MSTEQWNTPPIVGSPFDRHQLSGQWHVFMTLYKMTPFCLHKRWPGRRPESVYMHGTNSRCEIHRCILKCHLLDFTPLNSKPLQYVRNCSNTDECDPYIACLTPYHRCTTQQYRIIQHQHHLTHIPDSAQSNNEPSIQQNTALNGQLLGT